jgi:hypothetical protein
MFYFPKDDVIELFFEFFPDLKPFENNYYIDINYKAFTDQYTEIELNGVTYYVNVR